MIDSINASPNQSLTERAIKTTIRVRKKLRLGLDSKFPKNVKKPSSEEISWQQQLADELYEPIKRNFTRRRVAIRSH